MQASYLASVEGSITSALMSARNAFNAQEEVLSRDPKRSAAGVVVGTYRYVVSGLALPSRMFAYIVGFGGGKEEGIRLLETAARDPDLASRLERRSSSFTAARGVMRTRTGCSASSSPPIRATGCSSWSRGRRPFVPASTPRRRPF